MAGVGGVPLVPATPETKTNSSLRDDCVDDWKQWGRTHDLVLVMGSTLLVVIGTIGNTVTFYVLKRKPFRRNVISGALRYLAVLDNICLWTVVPEIFIKGAFHYDITSINWETCGFFPFYFWTMTSIDSWLLVVITAARLLHMKCPKSIKTICTVFNYYLILAVIHVAVVTAHGGVQLHIYSNFEKDKPIKETCYFLIQRAEAKNPILMVITISVNFLVPCVLLIVMNILMVRGLRKLEREQKAIFNALQESRKQSATKSFSIDKSANAVGPKKKLSSQELTIDLCSEQNPGELSQTMQLKTSDEIEAVSAPVASDFTKYNLNENAGETQYMVESDVDNMKRALTLKLPGQRSKRGYDESTFVSTASNKTTSTWWSQISAARKEHILFAFESSDDGDAAKPQRYNSANFGQTRESDSSRGTSRGTLFSGTSVRLNSLTRLLTLAAAVYLTLNIPFWSFHVFFADMVLPSVDGCYLKDLIPYSTFILQYLNHAINFYIYCASGSQFRTELLAMIQR